MGTVAVISASLGGFDARRTHEKQSVGCDFYHFSDENYPPRSKSMTSRLQARIVKMFMPDFVAGYDYYLWVDSSCQLARPNTVQWFLDKLGDNDIAVFKHPHRKTVREESDYLKHRLAIKCPYVTPRYQNESIDEQLAAVLPEDELFASTAFIYKDSPVVREAMKEWWFHTSRYHSIDQLSFPYAIRSLKISVILDNYLKCGYIEYVRNR